MQIEVVIIKRQLAILEPTEDFVAILSTNYNCFMQPWRDAYCNAQVLDGAGSGNENNIDNQVFIGVRSE